MGQRKLEKERLKLLYMKIQNIITSTFFPYFFLFLQPHSKHSKNAYSRTVTIPNIFFTLRLLQFHHPTTHIFEPLSVQGNDLKKKLDSSILGGKGAVLVF